MFPYVVQQLYEAYKRYAQLQMLISQGQASIEYLKLVNSGMDNIMGLIAAAPIKDEKILEDIRNLQKGIKKIEELYGMVPKSAESAMQLLHDQTVVESFEITNSAKEYANSQEANAIKAQQMAGLMSPKGAARLSAATQAQILHTMTQILKVNGQLLKLQGEQFAMANKESKNSVSHFNQINSDMKKSFSGFSGDLSFPRF